MTGYYASHAAQHAARHPGNIHAAQQAAAWAQQASGASPMGPPQAPWQQVSQSFTPSRIPGVLEQPTPASVVHADPDTIWFSQQSW